MMFTPDKIRNINKIAHIDHGKTTLLDALLKQSQVFQTHEIVPERVMDSYDQEKERGITIFAKQTSIFYDDYKINIIDTPGHSDFSGEVERVLGMVNSVLLLVDAKEGPMPQTRFVLKKALEMGFCPIVVLNKIDRPAADPDHVLNLTFDLFVELGATDKQLDFIYCYASGLSGYAQKQLDDPKKDLKPLLDLIIEAVPSPKGDVNLPFLMQVNMIGYDPYIGRQSSGRIINGVVKKGSLLECRKNDGTVKSFQVQKIEGFIGLKKTEMDEAGVGDIVVISGIDEVTIGDVICNEENTVQLDPIFIEEPTLSVDFMVNSGPLAGKEGRHVTMNKIRDRLMTERKSNVTLHIEEPKNGVDKISVSGRGELHLAVLMEAMRRENFEFLVSKPQVILKKIEGKTCEPIELVHVEIPSEFEGVVIQELGMRKGELRELQVNDQNITSMDFFVPTRGLMGCLSELLTLTKGLVIMTSVFDHYAPWKGLIPRRKQGALISICAGTANGYACFQLQKRGELFVKPGDVVYEGMIIGAHSRENDLVVNVTKAKQLTNVRSAGKDESILLTPPRKLTLEQAINFIEDDERVEITPQSIRLRKKYLTENERKKMARESKTQQ